jgi:ABC-type Fe3+/spermidine/putrescine transport system ATPase subunit
MIELNDVAKEISTGFSLAQISFHVPRGSTLALFGPSGCGKTTTLRLIAGFERPDAGSIHINGELAGTADKVLAPFRRGVGMVFQDLALWPHMKARQHLEFVLDGRVKGRDLKARKISQMLERVELGGKGDAYPHQLSGGEKQRLAMARALVVEPAVLLMDEPLSSLDAHLRSAMLRQTRSLIKELHMTTVYVTHDWHEAVYLADHIAMMQGGRIRKTLAAASAGSFEDDTVARNPLDRKISERPPGALAEKKKKPCDHALINTSTDSGKDDEKTPILQSSRRCSDMHAGAVC